MSSKAKTIIRLKRKREDDPLDAFLVSEDPKRRLTESAVFSLVESVSSKEFQTLFPRVPPKPSLAHNLERKRAVLSSKKIEEAREARYKIIESNRNFSVGTETYTLIDVTKHTIKETVTVESISNLVQDMDVDESKYVYDIYYHDSERPVHDVLNQRVGTL